MSTFRTDSDGSDDYTEQTRGLSGPSNCASADDSEDMSGAPGSGGNDRLVERSLPICIFLSIELSKAAATAGIGGHETREWANRAEFANDFLDSVLSDAL